LESGLLHEEGDRYVLDGACGPVYSAAEAGVERLVPGRQRVISVWRTGPSRGRTAGKNFFLIFRLYGPEKVFSKRRGSSQTSRRCSSGCEPVGELAKLKPTLAIPLFHNS
jgi:hypothetical protein